MLRNLIEKHQMVFAILGIILIFIMNLIFAEYLPELWFSLLIFGIILTPFISRFYFNRYLYNNQNVALIKKYRNIFVAIIIGSGSLLFISRDIGLQTLIERYYSGWHKINEYESSEDYWGMTTIIHEYRLSNPTLEFLLNYSELILMILVFLLAGYVYQFYDKIINRLTIRYFK
jgi:hypothetical protein